MKSRFGNVLVLEDTSDPEPGPTPFPIKIIQESSKKDKKSSSSSSSGNNDVKKRSDYFYPAWEKFLALEPARAKSTSIAARKNAEERVAAGEEGLTVKENASTSWEQAAKECRERVAAIKNECQRLNQKYRDAIFDLEANEYCLMSLNGHYPQAVEKIDAPPWIKRVEDIFDDPQFFIDGASATDVHQGSSGDCWLLASLMAVSAKKELIEKLCVARDEKAGVYGFVFYRDGEWIHEVIDDKLYLRVGDDDDLQIVRDWGNKDNKVELGLNHDKEKMKTSLQRGGEALYFSHCKSNETWLPLIEKAYAKAHGDYRAIESGFASEGIEDLTGGVGVTINPEDIMDKDRFWREQLSQVNEKYLFGAGSKDAATKGIASSHAYAVLEAWEEGNLRLLKLRNPWGKTEWEGDWSDGSKLWTAEMMTKLKHTFGDDGIFWISYTDFLKHFPQINRVRLFNSDWQVAQQWTAVNVPWTVDYLDTKFQFTISEKCPVVVVLSQPDSRYWHNLSGRFNYSLHFRICKDGEEEDRWIVRSMHSSGSYRTITRSVSAEIDDLEPGTYSVLIKVTATRCADNGTPAEFIYAYATNRKEKLLDVGRRFDYAHTKGNLRGLEKANQALVKSKAREKEVSGLKATRKMNQMVKEKKKLCQRRIDEAIRKRVEESERRQREEKKTREAKKRERKARDKGKDEVKDKAKEAEVAKKEEPEAHGAVTGIESNYNGSDRSRKSSKDDLVEFWEAKAKEGSQDGREVDQEDAAKRESAEDGCEDSRASNGEQREGKNVKANSTDEKASAKGKAQEVISIDSEQSISPSDSASQEDEDSESEDDDAAGLPDPFAGLEIIEPPLENDDFDWDSEIDDPPVKAEDDEDLKVSATGEDNEIFASDPWNAMCVLGLRVYAKGAEAKVRVVKGRNNS